MSERPFKSTLAALKARVHDYDTERSVRHATRCQPLPAPPLPPPAAATLRRRQSPAAPFSSSRRAVQRLQDAALRGATAGLTLRGGLHLVSYVLHLLLRNSKKRQRPAGDRPDALAMLKDTVRWGAFLGSFSGGYTVLLPCRRDRLCST